MSSQRWYVNQSCDTSEFATYWNGLGGQAYWPRETGVQAAVGGEHWGFPSSEWCYSNKYTSEKIPSVTQAFIQKLV